MRQLKWGSGPKAIYELGGKTPLRGRAPLVMAEETVTRRIPMAVPNVSDAAWRAFGATKKREELETHLAYRNLYLVTAEELVERTAGTASLEEIRRLKDEVELLKRYVSNLRQQRAAQRESADSFWDRIAANMTKGRALLTFTDPLDPRLGRPR